MEYVLQISTNIIIIGWALIIILWVLICLYILLILTKINSTVKDMQNKYHILVSTIIRPFSIMSTLINKIKKNE